MKHLFLTTALAVFCNVISAQTTNLQDLTPKPPYDNVTSQVLDTDERASSFVIWVKENVKAHRHELHSEIIYVLEGTGEMSLGDEKFEIKPGDYVYIPKNTVHAVQVTSKTPLKVLSIQAPKFEGKDRVFVED